MRAEESCSMYYDSIQKNRRRVIFIIAGIFLVIMIWSLVSFISRQGKVAVVISAVPSDAKIMFDDEQQGNGTKWIAPGDYIVTTKKDGFESVTRKVRITEQKSQNVVAVSLAPKSDDAKNWAEKNAEQYQKNEAFGTIEANANGEYFTEINPITSKLPFVDPYFKIAYVTNDDQSIKLTISTPSPRYRFYAIEKIREFGYDPTDFVIEFKDFKNPLGGNDVEQKKS